MRQVKSTPHNHLRTSSHITKAVANSAVEVASKRLGRGGIFGVINFNPSDREIDPRWQLFVDNLSYDKISTGNGVYLEEPDILVVRGQEVPTKEGYHVLLIGTTPDQNVQNGMSLDDVLRLGREFKAKIDADHPFHKHGIGSFLFSHLDYLELFDSIEIGNGIAVNTRNYKNANLKAQGLFVAVKRKFRDSKLTASVSDDGHSIYELGRNYSIIVMPQDYKQFRDSPKELTDALKCGYIANNNQGLGYKMQTSRRGAIDHYLDLMILIAAKKFLGWDPNKKTAPLFEKFGISI